MQKIESMGRTDWRWARFNYLYFHRQVSKYTDYARTLSCDKAVAGGRAISFLSKKN